jgi:hypothetical protein
MKIKKALGVLPKGILTPCFIQIAAAVMKRALLTDDDGRHIIAIAHQKFNMIYFQGQNSRTNSKFNCKRNPALKIPLDNITNETCSMHRHKASQLYLRFTGIFLYF